MDGLILTAGGVLNDVRFVFDSTKQVGADVATDVTHRSSEFLMDEITLDSGVRLLDVINLLQKDVVLQSVFRRVWSAEYAAAAMKCDVKPFTGEYDAEGIEYLEIYSIWEKDTDTKEVTGTHHLSFHGMGFELREDGAEDEMVIFKKGVRIPWGIGHCPIGELLDIPLRINPTIEVCEANPKSDKYGSVIETFVANRPTLAQVIHAILWELSYYGGPEDNAAFCAKVGAAHDE